MPNSMPNRFSLTMLDLNIGKNAFTSFRKKITDDIDYFLRNGYNKNNQRRDLA